MTARYNVWWQGMRSNVLVKSFRRRWTATLYKWFNINTIVRPVGAGPLGPAWTLPSQDYDWYSAALKFYAERMRGDGWLNPTDAEKLSMDRDWWHDLHAEAVDTYERRLAGTYQPRGETAL